MKAGQRDIEVWRGGYGLYSFKIDRGDEEFELLSAL